MNISSTRCEGFCPTTEEIRRIVEECIGMRHVFPEELQQGGIAEAVIQKVVDEVMAASEEARPFGEELPHSWAWALAAPGAEIHQVRTLEWKGEWWYAMLDWPEMRITGKMQLAEGEETKPTELVGELRRPEVYFLGRIADHKATGISAVTGPDNQVTRAVWVEEPFQIPQ